MTGLFILLSGLSCKTQSPGNPKTPPVPEESSVAPGVESPVVKKLSPTLKTVGVDPIRYEGQMIPMINAVGEKDVTFIRIRVCPQSKDCFTQETPYESYLMPGLPHGRISFFIAGCAYQGGGEPVCSPERKLQFIQEVSKDQELSQLLGEKTKIDQGFVDVGKGIYQAMVSFDKLAKECQDPKIYGMFSQETIRNYLASGPHFIALGLQKPGAQLVMEGVDGQKVVYLESEEQVLPGTAQAGGDGEKKEGEAHLSPVVMLVVSGIVIAIAKPAAEKAGKSLSGIAKQAPPIRWINGEDVKPLPAKPPEPKLPVDPKEGPETETQKLYERKLAEYKLAKAQYDIDKPVFDTAKGKYDEAMKPRLIAKHTLMATGTLGVLGVGAYALYSAKDSKVLEGFAKEFAMGMIALAENQACTAATDQIKAIGQGEEKAEKLREEALALDKKIELLIHSKS